MTPPTNIIPFPGAPMADETASAWYVIRSATRREDDAIESLTKKGFPAYLPQGTRWQRLRRVKAKVSFPLFPGYLFVECCPTDFAAILKMDGIHDFLRVFNGAGIAVPLAVSEAIIEGVSHEELRGVFDTTRPSKREVIRADRIARGYKKGERVIVLNGAYAGFMSTVLRMTKSNRRAVIEGPNVVLTLNVTDIDPVVVDGEKAA